MAVDYIPAAGEGTMLVIPLQPSGFGAPVGQIELAVPNNDQIMMH